MLQDVGKIQHNVPQASPSLDEECLLCEALIVTVGLLSKKLRVGVGAASPMKTVHCPQYQVQLDLD